MAWRPATSVSKAKAGHATSGDRRPGRHDDDFMDSAAMVELRRRRRQWWRLGQGAVCSAHALPHISYRAEFGRSALKCVQAYILKNPQNWEALELRSLVMGGGADPKIHTRKDRAIHIASRGKNVTRSGVALVFFVRDRQYYERGLYQVHTMESAAVMYRRSTSEIYSFTWTLLADFFTH